jgi:hypothetical protein
MMKDELSLFFWGRKNKVGMAGAIAGCGVVAAGLVAGPLALLIPPALYAAGALATPSESTSRLEIANSNDMELVKRDLKRLCERANKKLPSDLAQLVEQTQATILEILNRTKNVSRAANPELHTVRQTALDYLPTALNEYLELPPQYAKYHKNAYTGRTAQEELKLQLELLDEQMTEALNAILDGNTAKLINHGEFLRSKFERNDDLDIDKSAG